MCQSSTHTQGRWLEFQYLNRHPMSARNYQNSHQALEMALEDLEKSQKN